MNDPLFDHWPRFPGRSVQNAEAQVVDEYQKIYRIEFLDSANKKLTVQLPDTALWTLAQTAAARLGLELRPLKPTHDKG